MRVQREILREKLALQFPSENAGAKIPNYCDLDQILVKQEVYQLTQSAVETSNVICQHFHNPTTM